MRYRAVIEYDGSDFSGWQRQSDARTVQGELESAIRAVTGEGTNVVGGGRTDAGVHASGQAAHFDSIWKRDAAELQRALNASLADDAAIRVLEPAPPGFHARHSAVGRQYRYDLYSGPTRSPLRRRKALYVRTALDVELMRRAARALVGSHDFASFGRPMSPGGSTIRRLDSFEVVESERGLACWVEGNAFVRHQVRRMVGLLVDIGRGALPLESVGALLDKAPDGPTARRLAAHGLTLTAIRYPSDEAIRSDPASWGILTGE